MNEAICKKCGEHIDEFLPCCCLSDETKDNMAVDKFAKAMKEKLAKARAKGRRGWDDKEACSDEHLSALFHSHLKKCNDGNFIDLANFLMFLHVRGANPKALILKCSGCKFFYSYGVFQKCDGCNRAERKDLFEPKDNA